MTLFSSIVVSGCTDFQFKTYNGTYFSFRYPDEWEAKTITENQSVVTAVPKNELGNNNQSVATFKFLGNFSLTPEKITEIFNPYRETEKRKLDPNFKMIENRSITVDGVNSYDFVLQDSSSDGEKIEEHELILFEKNGKVYEIHLNSTPEDFFRVQGEFLDMVASFITV
ncbi:MAG: PsbP-related protein [Methanomicrobiales archaeon]